MQTDPEPIPKPINIKEFKAKLMYQFILMSMQQTLNIKK
jgi:hypothetical protein